MFCSNCGSKLAEGARFCSHCGTPVAAQEEPRTVFDNTSDEIIKEPVQETTKPIELNLDWESVDDEAPSKSAFDRRVSFDWTSVIDETHRKNIVDIKSPWDDDDDNSNMPETVVAEIPSAHTAPAQKKVDDELMKEFEGIDVAPTTEKGRTLTFIEILKKEREEKERAAEEAAAKLSGNKAPETGDSFEEMTYIQAVAAEIREAAFEPAPMVEPVSAGADITESIQPAEEPQSFVQSAEEEMSDLKDAYNEAKTEVPEFDLPSFGITEELSEDKDDEDETEAGAYDELGYEFEDETGYEPVEDMYLSDSFEAASDSESADSSLDADEPVDDEFEVDYIYAGDGETEALEDLYLEPEEPSEEETASESEPTDVEPEDNRTSEEKLEAELAAILASGNGYIPETSDEANEIADVDFDLYASIDELSAQIASSEKDEDEESHEISDIAEETPEEQYESYDDVISAEQPVQAEPVFAGEPLAEMEVTPEEAAAEEYFADMIEAVTDRSQDPLADVDHLTIEDIFDDEYMSGIEASDEASSIDEAAEEKDTEEPSGSADMDDKDSEIQALKRRLAELLAEKEEETDVPANPAAPTIEDLFPEEEAVPEFNLVEEIDEETDVVVEDEEPELEPETDAEEYAAEEEPSVPELEEVPAEESAEEEFPEETEEVAVEEPEAEPETETELTQPVQEEPVFEPYEYATKNDALEDIADLQSDAMSIEELEKELFGEEALSEDNEAEATRKIDKFYTLYKKNEEFQKLLDDEYNRIQFQDDEPTELSDATITQLDNFVLSEKDLKDAEKASIEETVAPSKDKAPVADAPKAPKAEATKPAPVMEEEISPKEAKKAEKAARKAAKKAAKESAPDDDEEEGGTALTIIAVVIAIILVLLLAAILILNFAPDSAMGQKLDSLVQSFSYMEDIDVNDGYLL